MGRGSSGLGGGAGGGKPSEKSLEAQSSSWYYNLTNDEKNAITSMQYSNQSLNEFLSGRRTDFDDATKQRLQKQAQDVDSALAKFTTDSEIVVYRGVSSSEFTNTYLGIDTVTRGVKSTSYDPDRADAFAKNQGGFIIEYHVKPGRHGADVNGVPGANEREFLIRNNMPQKTISKQGNKIIVEIG